MRVGIDARFVGTPGGIGRYTEELIRHLGEIDSENEYVLFLRSRGRPQMTTLINADRAKIVITDVLWYTLAEQLRMPAIIDRERLDLVHFPHWNVPLGVRTPFVLTIHDLILFDHPSRRATTQDPLRYMAKSFGHRIVIRNAVRRARKIISPSEYTKRRILERFHIAEEKIVVIPEGVRQLFAPVPSPQSLVPRVLYVGNAYPHKNLERLLAAFADVRKKIPDAELLIAGNDDYFFKRTSKIGGEGVRFIGGPSDEDLENLYASARLFVIPSLVEGFGLTPLEAMARGIPVAASRGGALPEVLGEAAMYFDPERTDEMARVIVEVMTDEGARRELVVRGSQQAARYSWRRAAILTRGVYQATIGYGLRTTDYRLPQAVDRRR